MDTKIRQKIRFGYAPYPKVSKNPSLSSATARWIPVGWWHFQLWDCTFGYVLLKCVTGWWLRYVAMDARWIRRGGSIWLILAHFESRSDLARGRTSSFFFARKSGISTKFPHTKVCGDSILGCWPTRTVSENSSLGCGSRCCVLYLGISKYVFYELH